MILDMRLQYNKARQTFPTTAHAQFKNGDTCEVKNEIFGGKKFVIQYTRLVIEYR